MHVRAPAALLFPADDIIANVALPAMNRDQALASGAGEPCLLFPEKGLHATIPYGLKILYHAHPEVTAVAGVDVLKMSAWKIGALEAVSDFAFCQKLAVALQPGAFLVSGAAALTMRYLSPLARDLIQVRKISAAYRTVHAAWSYQVFFHLSFRRLALKIVW
jgi:hypothetical protein